jgi:hypothetical protein
VVLQYAHTAAAQPGVSAAHALTLYPCLAAAVHTADSLPASVKGQGATGR